MLCFFAALLLGICAGQQHQNAYEYVNWEFTNTTGFWNVDQDVWLQQTAEASFWAMDWKCQGQTYGGYMGLQQLTTDSASGLAIFSLWNATAAQPGKGAHCQRFSEEGGGWSCRLKNFTLTPSSSMKNFYRYRIWRLNADAYGQWWGAWIRDHTGVEVQLGKIRTTTDCKLVGRVSNFAEYFGTVLPCGSVPESVVGFTQPAADSQGSSKYQYYSMYKGYTKGSCTGGSVHPSDLGWTNASLVTLGGKISPA
eukprot:TRINITY_DN60636_c1_g1_i1.p1 TRINITY_DN60636_c1_g1~~TRINITY_DN60636_c1_g1_i1.p1  ORF type:complete len:252 (+),score=21.58 TRINITY_DN60636_c1_g1_i1:18-773(+)